MSNLSEIGNKNKSDEYILKIPSSISQPLKEFISEKHYLFDYYRRHKNLKQPSILELLWNTIIDFFWKNKYQKIFTLLILACFTILLSQVFTQSLNKFFVTTIMLLYLVLFYIKTIIYLVTFNKKQKKGVNHPVQWIDLAETYDPRNHKEVIKNIGENNSVRDIKTEEQRFKIVTISQSRAKNVANSAIPLLSFFYTVLILFVFGIPQNWGNSLNIATISGFGIVSLVIAFFSFLAELSSKNLLIYQHCLFILQEALLIAEEREKSNKLISVEDINEKYEYLLQELKNIAKEIKTKEKKSSINKNIKGRSLMAGLKKIKTIEAPEDFSTNFDAYMSGDKGAGRDIY